MQTKPFMDNFTVSYIEAALWSSTDDEGENLDRFTYEDFDEDSLARIMDDCQQFQASEAWQAALAAEEDPRTDDRQAHGYTLEASAGHDFWLTRCGHGAGFWDGDWKEPHATALDQLSKSFGNIDLYVGDDGKVYAA